MLGGIASQKAGQLLGHMISAIENTYYKVSCFWVRGQLSQEVLVILIKGYCSHLSSSECYSQASALSGREWYASQEHRTVWVHIIVKCGQYRQM
jgi:hypothetical protein